MDDVVRGNPSSGLRLACGCNDADWHVASNFPAEAKEHLERVHGMRPSASAYGRASLPGGASRVEQRLTNSKREPRRLSGLRQMTDYNWPDDTSGTETMD
jgi:hypothetical protein